METWYPRGIFRRLSRRVELGDQTSDEDSLWHRDRLRGLLPLRCCRHELRRHCGEALPREAAALGCGSAWYRPSCRRQIRRRLISPMVARHRGCLLGSGQGHWPGQVSGRCTGPPHRCNHPRMPDHTSPPLGCVRTAASRAVARPSSFSTRRSESTSTCATSSGRSLAIRHNTMAIRSSSGRSSSARTT